MDPSFLLEAFFSCVSLPARERVYSIQKFVDQHFNLKKMVVFHVGQRGERKEHFIKKEANEMSFGV